MEPGTRGAVLSSGALVAANHPAVAAVGIAELGRGGNAIDATLAMAAMSWLALPGQCGIGGDAFCVAYEPDGRVWTVGASGYGPDGGVPDFYVARGLRALPLSGALAVAAPGAPAALAALQSAGATRSLEQLWAPAIRAARRGVPCTAKTRGDVLEHELALRGDPGTAGVFLPRGRVPDVGERLVYHELADTMARIADEPSSIYHGELAERAVAALSSASAPFTGAEWAASGEAPIRPAITHRYADVILHETPPPSPGWMLLQQAALLDGRLSELEFLGPEAVTLFAAAARRAFQDRWERCGSDTERWQELLEPAAVADARARLAAQPPVVAGVLPDGDTTSTLVVDADGRAVSFIQSLAFTFGAHVTVPGTGILLNNRLGRGAYLVAGHPNEVRPRRRPLHTLNAWLATDARGRLAHAGNTPGGDGQVQWNMQVISHLVDHRRDPQQAVSAPRFTIAPGSDANGVGGPAELIVERRLADDTLSRLGADAGAVRVVGPWAAGGGALAVSVDHQRGCLWGGADPRQDGVVLGA